jgi:molecular chaperone GrpE
MTSDKDADRTDAGHGSGNGPAPSRPFVPGEPEIEHGVADAGVGGPGVAGGGIADAEVIADEDVTDDIAADVAIEADPLAVCRAERDEYLDSLRRLQAEFENYKKRMIKQQGEQTARGAMMLLEKLLPVLDTLDLAIEHMGDPGSVDGRALEAVYSQLRDVLTKEGLERISPIGEHFDPTAHEAVAHLPAEDPASAGAGPGMGADTAAGGAGPQADDEPVVAEVMRAGYRWRGTVVRPAMVMVRG